MTKEENTMPRRIRIDILGYHHITKHTHNAEVFLEIINEYDLNIL